MKSKKIASGTVPEQKTSPRRKSKKRSWKVVHPHAAGIDVGSNEYYVAVPPDAPAVGEPIVRVFGVFTEDMEALVEWLKACKVDTVAMESTGVYWVALYQALEAAGLEVILVNAQMLKHVPGKTDVQDCQWLQRLHTYGLLRGSFRPDDPICRLRTLVRHRANLVSSGAEHILQMQKALIQMNVRLHQVVSRLTGETGLRILRAIVHGERDPDRLILLRDSQITKSTEAQMRKALVGDWRPELLFVLRQNLRMWDLYQAQMRECDLQIETQLKAIPTAPEVPKASGVAAADPLASPNPKKKRPQSIKRNDPEIDLAPELTRICGVDLTAAHGLRVLSVLVLLSEIGVDPTKWRNHKAFCSWLGLCPNNRISGGKVLSTRTRLVANRAATALRMAAVGVAETETWIGSFYRRMRSRQGPAGATTATARKIAVVVYHLLKNREGFVDRDLALYEERVHRNRVAYLKKQAARIGFKLIPASADQIQTPEEKTITE